MPVTPSYIHYVPIITSLVTVPFTIILYLRWRKTPESLHFMWWMFGVFAYGIGTLTESLTTILGWQEWIFRSWYISGALLGGAPLAQGTVYLLLKTRTAHRYTFILVLVILTASICVLLSPIDMKYVEGHRLSGKVLGWQWVRAFSPFINIYALFFLMGGAFWSAWKYFRRDNEIGVRVIGNVCIAVGALLPGIGGSFTRFDYVEVLYATELIGISFIWIGYHVMSHNKVASIH